MQVKDIIKYCENKNKAYIDYPFGDIPICFKVNKKITSVNIVAEFNDEQDRNLKIEFVE